MDLRYLTDKILLEKTQALAKSEREITLQVLQHLREVERRSLFAKLSYSSLFEYAVKELKYSESSAQRRISGMKLLKELPELEVKIESGALPLSTLSQAQSFFRQEKTKSFEKLDILNSLENKTSREIEKELVSRSSEPEKLVKDKLRAVSITHTEVKFLADEEFISELEKLKALLSHKMPNASLKEIMVYAMKETVGKLLPKEPQKQNISKQQSKTSKPTTKNTRFIPIEVKRQVWKRDQGRCSYNCEGKRCNATHFLEYDHIKPFAMGGVATLENLRLRCRTHNQLVALKSFGIKKISQFVPRML